MNSSLFFYLQTNTPSDIESERQDGVESSAAAVDTSPHGNATAMGGQSPLQIGLQPATALLPEVQMITGEEGEKNIVQVHFFWFCFVCLEICFCLCVYVFACVCACINNNLCVRALIVSAFVCMCVYVHKHYYPVRDILYS